MRAIETYVAPAEKFHRAETAERTATNRPKKRPRRSSTTARTGAEAPQKASQNEKPQTSRDDARGYENRKVQISGAGQDRDDLVGEGRAPRSGRPMRPTRCIGR